MRLRSLPPIFLPIHNSKLSVPNSSQVQIRRHKQVLHQRITHGSRYGGMCLGSRLRLKCDGIRAETRFRLSTKRRSPFKLAGASVQSTTGSRGVHISGSNAGYTMFRGSVNSTGYPLNSPVSPSLPLPASPCAITFQPHRPRYLCRYSNWGIAVRCSWKRQEVFLSSVTPTTVLGPNIPPIQLAPAALYPGIKRSRREAIY